MTTLEDVEARLAAAEAEQSRLNVNASALFQAQNDAQDKLMAATQRVKALRVALSVLKDTDAT